MKTKQKTGWIIILLAVAGLHHSARAGGNKTEEEWYPAKSNGEISLFYRWVEGKDGIKTREMKAEFTINSEIPGIIAQFSTTGNYLKWAAGIKKSGI